MSKATLCLLLLLSALPGYGNTLELQYEGFYRYLKAADDVEFNQVNPLFMLVSPEHAPDYCLKGTPHIRTEHQVFPIVVSRAFGEFYVPYDKKLKTDRAVLVFDAPNTCELKIQVVGRMYKQVYTRKEIVTVAEQLYMLMKNFAGSVSFMMPNWSGVTFLLEDGERVQFNSEDLPELLEFSQEIRHLSLVIDKE